MPRWQHARNGAPLSMLTVLFAGYVWSNPNVASADPSATVAAQGVCVVGRPTAEGVECQAFRTDDGRLYTLIGNLGGLTGDKQLCVCGETVEVSSCMQGTTIAVRRIGPRNACP